jgi:hypothetical protein
MKPKNFKEANVTFAKDQPEYQPLPAFRADSQDGEVITCWNLSFSERLRILFKGEIWLSLLTFNKPLTPCFLTTKKSTLFKDRIILDLSVSKTKK